VKERRKVWRSRKGGGKFSRSVRGRFIGFRKVELELIKLSGSSVLVYLSVILCALITQYSKTNAMHFLFSLLRIKGLYVFRALPAHPQESLHKRHLLYGVRVDCTRVGVEL
jgi:hypothetical protein